jgi:hypothetical protein
MTCDIPLSCALNVRRSNEGEAVRSHGALGLPMRHVGHRRSLALVVAYQSKEAGEDVRRVDSRRGMTFRRDWRRGGASWNLCHMCPPKASLA